MNLALLRGERRRPVAPPAARCSLCHEAGGDVLVLAGIGRRTLHDPCRTRLEAMGYVVHADRRMT